MTAYTNPVQLEDRSASAGSPSVLIVDPETNATRPRALGLLVGSLLGDNQESLTTSRSLERLTSVRRQHILKGSVDSNFNVSKAARRLSMHRRALQRYLDQHHYHEFGRGEPPQPITDRFGLCA